ncbi:hypothetical protein F3K40_11800 [Streptomyces sp. LBUM 1478]|nr:hypothetical protein [Streptomyces sp. LBUM 1484]MBP5867713.1 hypothetical protein [Streptomyces sp. LBUM 1485]MBP5876197.1 hypothetical protein [Streptomyces sp. LBUM 1477]MBP5883935.1 hypothetical protein [Streptomyces sp. LBUM 1487]MBP5893259.1 hypothetical protein [Streptomyces sp. LBUM 1481]MBP5899950.1 hypothetical protein [Streptomyces sp. LBUM 1488]MBP5906274.1 hypothetical protein [Streptomyces sp. LBUM 1478]MBP5916478.1 hypothetical protein [Streptomyces sp. LBUM 1486]MBP592350
MAAGARRAQQLGQQQRQLQRAAPRDPAERVEVSAKFASMPTSTAAHTSAVNFPSGMWMPVHLFRCIRAAKGLCPGSRGDMASNRASRRHARGGPWARPERADSNESERDRTPGRLLP